MISTRLWLVVVTLSCTLDAEPRCTQHSEQGAYSLMPVDVRYSADNEIRTLEVDSSGVVRLFLREETLHGKCLPASLDRLLGIVHSSEFGEALNAVRETESSRTLNERLLTIWARGPAYGATNGPENLHPSVSVSLAQFRDLPPALQQLIGLLDDIGSEAFGARHRRILQPDESDQ